VTTESDSLVAHADEAMYFAKKRGRNGFQFFNADMSVFSRERGRPIGIHTNRRGKPTHLVDRGVGAARGLPSRSN
jgi:hypothetical protein